MMRELQRELKLEEEVGKGTVVGAGDGAVAEAGIVWLCVRHVTHYLNSFITKFNSQAAD